MKRLLLILALLWPLGAAAQSIGPVPPASLPPSGAAGGDLGGTYPNPTVINGSHITNASIPNSGLATPAPCSAFGTTADTCAQGGVITGGGPTGSATVAPIITYNAAGQLTTVSSATITPAIGSITGLGTGVATLLGGNASGTGGPVGTTSPSLTTPSLGVATATSLAIGGCTIGSNGFCVTGTLTAGNNVLGASYATLGNVYMGYYGGGYLDLVQATGRLGFGSGTPDTFVTRAAAASLQLGMSDAASPSAQTLRVQSVVAGTAAANGANWTLIGSLPTGTGTSGDIILQTGVKTGSGTTQGTPTSALTLKGETQNIVFNGSNYTTCTALTTSSGVVTCTASAARFKEIEGVVSPEAAVVGLDKLRIGAPVWDYKDHERFGYGTRVGLIADDVAKMDARCVVKDSQGVTDYWDRCVIAYLVADRQAMKAEIEQLKKEVH